MIFGKVTMDNSDADKKVHLTREGLAELKQELIELTEEKQPQAIDRVAEARVMGDLAENNEYTQAKQELSFIEGRIAELEEVLSNAVIIDAGGHRHLEVSLGCKVTVATGKVEHTYHIVGEWEADPVEKKISPESPLGQALMGKKVGEEVEFEAPAGKIVYTILKIE